MPSSPCRLLEAHETILIDAHDATDRTAEFAAD